MALAGLMGRGLTQLVKGGVNPGRLGAARTLISKNSQAIDKLGNVLPYAPSILQGLGGDPLAGAASAGATRIAGKYGPLAQGATGLAAPLLMPSILGSVGSTAQAVAGGISGGIGNIISGGRERQRESGESSGLFGLGSGKPVGDMNVDEIIDFMQRSGKSQVEIAEALNPSMNQNLDRQMQRQMQLNQQLGQLTGSLNQQKYMAQLAGGAQAEAGATTRSMINSANPYAASVFQYRG